MAWAYGNRGVAYSNKGQYDRAIQDYDQALEIDPTLAPAFHNRGNAYSIKGQHARAIQDFDRALQLDPSYTRALRGRARAHFDLAHFDAAANDLAEAIEREPGDAYDTLWLFLARQRRDHGGAGEFEKDVAKLDLSRWPGPVLRYLQGQLSEDELRQAAKHTDPKIQNDQKCELEFYVGEAALVGAQRDTARALFELATGADCPKSFIEYQAAEAELARMN